VNQPGPHSDSSPVSSNPSETVGNGEADSKPIVIPADGVSVDMVAGELYDGSRNAAAPKNIYYGLRGSFWLLIIAQFSTAIIDNLFRWFVVNLGQTVLNDTQVLTFGGLCFVVPFILLTPLAGSLSDRFPKKRVVVGCKLGELGILIFGLVMIWFQQPIALFVAVALFGAVNALFTPAKFGSIPELAGNKNLGMGNAAMGLVTIGGTALGTVGGYALFAAAKMSLDTQPSPSQMTAVAVPMIAVVVVGLMAATRIRRMDAAAPTAPLKFNPITDTVPALRVLASDRVLLRTALGIAFFWALAGLAQLAIDIYGEDLLQLSITSTGGLMVVLVLGVGTGSVLAGILCRDKIQLGLVPMAALGIATGSLIMFLAGTFAEHSASPASWTWAACVGLLILGMSAGFFDVPLEAYLQEQSKPEIRGTVLAAANFLVFTGMALSCGLFYLLTDDTYGLGWTAESLFLLGGLGTIPIVIYSFFALPSATLRLGNWLLSHTLYKVKVDGIENIPKEGGALIISNHVSWMDGCILTAISPRPVRFMIHSPYTQGLFMSFLAKQAGFIAVNATGGPKQLVRALAVAREALDNGEVVCIFPEGALSRTGQLQPFQRGALKVLKGTTVPIIPVYLAGLWGSIFSYHGGKFFWKFPKRCPYPVTIRIGKPVDEPPKNPAFLRKAVERVGGEAMSDHHADDAFFLPRFVKTCKKAKFRKKVVDTTGKELSGGKLLAGVIAMSRAFSRQPFANADTVGVLLPPTVACSVVNAALAFRGQTSVNLNYTLSQEGIDICVAKGKLTHVLTSRAFLEKKPYTMPEGTEFVYLEDLRDDVSGADKAIGAFHAFITPSAILSRLLGFSKRQPDEVLTIVFTSGSTGQPKGVMLSYANVASQIIAIDQLFHLTKNDCVLGVLPTFHSYGLSDAMWMPLCSPPALAMHTNPLDAKTIGTFSEEQKVSIIFATPTFLRTYMKRCTPKQFESVDLVVVGAEKMPPELAEKFAEKFGVLPTEGYGTTELSPFTAVNVPDHRCQAIEQKGTKMGTVGRVMPGSIAKTVDPESLDEVDNGKEGLLMIKGPNVMLGYLDEPEKTAEVVIDGWYDTGDLAVIDEEGFIEITGRKSRFSKIGGEMVPHIRVEQAIERVVADAMGEDEESDEVTQAVAVASVPDARKGERLVVLHRRIPISPEDVLTGLAPENLPNLWLPSADAFFEVDEIPMLGSGKLDLKLLGELTAERASTPAR
jgi:acyl-[acyl-carrier-protein]-phospholipid O-acyltransferase/long-chain-fatty-acid--[acyl-carrier-protein] ligase